MIYRIDHDLHIHSGLSLCSGDAAQTPQAILQYAQKYGLKTVCITDHYWDDTVPGASNWYQKQNFDHIAASRPLPQDGQTRFLFGCETDMKKDMVIGIPNERFRDFDFVIIPTTHLHMRNFTIAEEDMASVERCAALWVERLDHLLSLDLPFRKIGVAHPACSLLHRQDHLAVLDRVPQAELERLFAKAAEKGCGIELNAFDFDVPDAGINSVLRLFRTAKACGCKFYLGSDAHHPEEFEKAIPLFGKAIRLLDLTEDDKFTVPARA